MIYLDDKVGNINKSAVKQSNNTPKALINKNNLKADSVSFSGAKNNDDKSNRNKIIAGIASGLLIIGGIILLAKKGKIFPSDVDLGKRKVDVTGAETKISGYSSSSPRSTASSKDKVNVDDSTINENEFKKMLKEAEERAEEAKGTSKRTQKTLENAIKSEKEAEKRLKEARLDNEKIEKKLKKNYEWMEKEKENLRKMKEEFKKFYDDINDAWEKSEARREKYWKDFHSEFSGSNINNVSLIKLKNEAEQGLGVFRKFGKDSTGNVFDEISALDSVEGITVDKLKKAHWKLSKKYFPAINTGTEKEKIEATEIMKQINPANDNIRAYIEIKQK